MLYGYMPYTFTIDMLQFLRKKWVVLVGHLTFTSKAFIAQIKAYKRVPYK